MGLSEKRRVFRARAEALRRRAMDLIDEFRSPTVRDHLELVILRIEEELAWLEEEPAALATMRVSQFLPEAALCVMRLADLRRVAGPDARLPPDFNGRLDDRRDTKHPGS